MKKSLILIIFMIFGCLFTYLLIGIQVVGREHTTDYDFFIKKHPTTQMKFYNPVLCGECDFKRYEILSIPSKRKFRDLCYYRYDLTDISQCEDIFKPE